MRFTGLILFIFFSGCATMSQIVSQLAEEQRRTHRLVPGADGSFDVYKIR